MKFSKYEIRRIIYIMAAVIFVLIAGVIYCCYSNDKADAEKAEQDWESNISQTAYPDCADTANPYISEEITVHITGAVKSPGVYILNADSRINDVVNMAGGFKKDAAEDYLNLAERISDGSKIHVPSKKEVRKIDNKDDNKDHVRNTEDNSSADVRININTASKEELMTLPGIGEAKADAVISYRESIGKFENTEQLMEISGIKGGVYNKISAYITTE